MNSPLSPLQLLDYEVTQLTYERLAPGEETEEPGGVTLGFEMDARWDEEQEAQHITLVLHVNDNEEDVPEQDQERIIHRGHIGVAGWLAWVDDEQDRPDDATSIMLVNGLAMLYGIARVQLADLSAPAAPGSRKRLLLPSLSFRPIVEDWLEQEEGANVEE